MEKSLDMETPARINPAAILTALTTGQKDHITDTLRRDFSRTGASHILAVSGLHLSIIATLFFYLFKTILSLNTALLIRGWSRKGAAFLTLFPLGIYAVMSGWSDATQRAVIMIIIFMAASVIDRESDSFNSLGAAGIIILIMDPLAIFSVSFQLSFSAVGFILAGVSISRDFSMGMEIQILFFKQACNFIWISLCAIAGTQMLVMHYFHIFSFSDVQRSSIAHVFLSP